MAIKFHCEHCGKSISAPDNAGGKKGQCPACKDVVYVPAAEADELGLAPLDEDAERNRQRLVEENLRKEHDLLMAQSRPETSDEPLPDMDDVHGEGGIVLPTVVADAGSSGRAGADLRGMLITYLACMAGGQLDQAEAIVRRFRADPKSAKATIQQFLSDPARDARLANVPAPVCNGFLKQLQQALK